jgi:hypothetical protein
VTDFAVSSDKIQSFTTDARGYSRTQHGSVLLFLQAYPMLSAPLCVIRGEAVVLKKTPNHGMRDEL